MATVSGTFTAVGSSSALPVKHGEYVDYSLTGSAVATVRFEVDRNGSGKWDLIAELNAAINPAARWVNEFDECKVRFRCTAYTSGTVTYSVSDLDMEGQVIRDRYGVPLATAKQSGLDLIKAQMGDGVLPYNVTVALAASSTTDGMDITITVVDKDGAAMLDSFVLEWWISEDSDGVGLTGDSYSGTVTAGTGAILTALTAKKHFIAVTSEASGTIVATAVASANPTDQYVCVKHPVTGRVIVSAASGTNWEGAA